MAEDDESDIEAAIEQMLREDTSEADKVRRKPRPARPETEIDLDAPGPDHDAEDATEGGAVDETVPLGADDGIAAEMEQLRAERDDLRDRFIRAIADAENARKRSDRDRREAENYGGSKLSRDMLPVYDSLKRAVDSIGEDQREANAALIEGIELTLRELRNVFAKHGVTVIDPAIGDRFDPKIHEAMFEAPVPETKAGDIIQVMAEGFMLHDRLLRAAQVGVSSTPKG